MTEQELEALALAEAKREAWWRGTPSSYLLDDQQLQWHEMLWKVQPGNYAEGTVGKVARRRGKSFFAVTEAAEVCLNNEAFDVDYLAQTSGAAEGIVRPALDLILADCPKPLQPKFYAQDQIWEFPSTGSLIRVSGVDNKQYRRRRGQKSNFVVFDEFGFYLEPEDVEAVFNAQLFTTKGRALYISSPPPNPAHAFVARFYAALADGRAFESSIYDNPRFSRLEIDEFLRSEANLRGMDLEEFVKTTYCRREFFGDIVTEEGRAAVPGYTIERAATIVTPWERPQYRDHYTGLDIGYRDGHGVLFAYWDFRNAKLVIEDELVLRGKTTDELCSRIKEKEVALYGVERFDGTLIGAKDWTNVPDYVQAHFKATAQQQPYLRVADDNALILADIIQRHGIAFLPTRKDEKAAAVDDLDIAIRRNQIVILPNCKNLHKQLLTTIWDKNRREWERTADGHGELVDVLVYLWRNIQKNKSPEPEAPMGSWEKHIHEVNNPQSNPWVKLQRVRR